MCIVWSVIVIYREYNQFYCLSLLWYDLQVSSLWFTLSFPKISMITGTPTPDSSPAIAYRKICMITLDGRPKSLPISFIASAIVFEFHSCTLLILSFAFNSTLSIISQLMLPTDPTYYLRRMTFSKFSLVDETIIWFTEEVQSSLVDVS